MYIKKILSMLIVFYLILMAIPHLIVFAEIDMEHNCIEDFELRHNSWYVGPCRNAKATCIKNLIRYDGLEEFNNFLKDLAKNAEDEKEEKFWMPLLEKALISAGGTGMLGVFAYLSPAATVLSTFGTIVLGSAVYVLHDNFIEPIGETAGFFTKGFIKFKDWVVKAKKPENPDKGMLGNLNDALFGDKTKENVNEGLVEAIRKFLFGDRVVTILSKEKKQAFVREIRNELYQQIKDKKWVNNDFLFLCIDIDPKVMEYGLKFDNVSFPLNYKEPLKNYFKKVK